MKKKIVSMVTILLAGAAVIFLIVNQEEKPAMTTGIQAVNFELKDIHGNTYQLADFKGQTVVLNFFTTWCPSCKQEAQELEAFGNEVDDVQLIMIAKGEPQKRIEKYIVETNSKLLYLLDTKENVSKEYAVNAVPETLIINKEGIIIERFSGPITKDDLIGIIKKTSEPSKYNT